MRTSRSTSSGVPARAHPARATGPRRPTPPGDHGPAPWHPAFPAIRTGCMSAGYLGQHDGAHGAHRINGLMTDRPDRGAHALPLAAVSGGVVAVARPPAALLRRRDPATRRRSRSCGGVAPTQLWPVGANSGVQSAVAGSQRARPVRSGPVSGPVGTRYGPHDPTRLRAMLVARGADAEGFKPEEPTLRVAQPPPARSTNSTAAIASPARTMLPTDTRSTARPTGACRSPLVVQSVKQRGANE